MFFKRLKNSLIKLGGKILSIEFHLKNYEIPYCLHYNKGLKFSLIKYKGDHIHNLGVLKKKRGYLVVARATDGITSHPEVL